jgi:metallo-beta-lactamase family protein
MRIRFLGAADTVTGSRFLVETASARVLVDCGLFQGFKQLRLRNRAPFAVDPRKIDAILLTHAHLDHSGFVPALVRDGFSGKVLSTRPTRDLCRILLPDSGRLQEEEASFANEAGYSRHHPALPLYTEADAHRALESFRPVDPSVDVPVAKGLTARFVPVGHLLGAAMVRLDDGERSVVFSGDVGRLEDPLMKPPDPMPESDWVVIESTYGDRIHVGDAPEDHLGEVVRRTFARGGVVLIPSFAVGRAQLVLWLLHRLREAGKIPDVPIHVDSPMAQDATGLYQLHADWHRLSPGECEAAFRGVSLSRSVEDSKALGRDRSPKIIISASGMATGGRVLHHLKTYGPDPKATILFVGYQAPGTRGATILGGADAVKIHGGYVPIRAEVERLDNLSAHADQNDLITWLGGIPKPPKEVFVVHGEPAAADALRRRIEEQLGFAARVPDHLETVDLGIEPIAPPIRATTPG